MFSRRSLLQLAPALSAPNPGPWPSPQQLLSANATLSPLLAPSLPSPADAVTQGNGVALLSLVVVVSIFAFLGAFFIMMLSKNQTPRENASGDLPTPSGGGYPALQAPHPHGPFSGLDPRLIRCLPQEVYDSAAGGLKPKSRSGPSWPASLPGLTENAAASPDPSCGPCIPVPAPYPRAPSQAAHAPEPPAQLVAGATQPQEAAAPASMRQEEEMKAKASGGACLRECTVCLAEYRDGDVVKWLPDCHHAFHGSCIDAWLLARSTCPLCRVPVGPALVKLAMPA